MRTKSRADMRSGRGRRLRTAWLASCAGLLAAGIAVGETPSEPDAMPAARARGAAATRGATGSVSGRVVLGPKLSTRQVRFHLYPDAVAADTKRHAPPLANELKNVVVYVESVSSASGEPNAGARPSIRQEDLTFVPHVLAITKGTEVEFPNTDPVFHNVFSLSRAAAFDLGRYPKGSTKRVKFDAPGVVKVFCHIHSDMSAVVVVLDNPFFVSPDGEGQYTIGGLPPGDYRVTGWHERAHPVTRTIHVEAGKDTPADFNIPLVDDNGG